MLLLAVEQNFSWDWVVQVELVRVISKKRDGSGGVDLNSRFVSARQRSEVRGQRGTLAKANVIAAADLNSSLHVSKLNRAAHRDKLVE